MQTSTKKLIPTALKTFIPSWPKGPSFCEVYRLEDVTAKVALFLQMLSEIL